MSSRSSRWGRRGEKRADPRGSLMSKKAVNASGDNGLFIVRPFGARRHVQRPTPFASLQPPCSIVTADEFSNLAQDSGPIHSGFIAAHSNVRDERLWERVQRAPEALLPKKGGTLCVSELAIDTRFFAWSRRTCCARLRGTARGKPESRRSRRCRS